MHSDLAINPGNWQFRSVAKGAAGKENTLCGLLWNSLVPVLNQSEIDHTLNTKLFCHSTPGSGCVTDGDRAADRDVEAGGLVLVEPLPCRGCPQASPRRQTFSREEADPAGLCEIRDRAGDAAAGAYPALDGVGTGEEAGDVRLNRSRHL